MDGLTEGRIVHYVNHKTGKHMAAVVTLVWDSARGLVNLFVWPDMHAELEALTPTSVLFDPGATAGHARGTWHWIEKA